MKRRTFLAAAASGVAALAGAGWLGRDRILYRAEGIRRFPRFNRPIPTADQLAWQELELGLFIHLGMATFTGRENDVAPPDTFQPTALDTDQWLEAAVAMGARYAVLVAKHSDGFMLWQADAYPYGLKQSSWRSGKGDVVADFVASCAKYGVRPGIYASTCNNSYWNANYPGRVSGGAEKQAAYNVATEKMLTELWTRYGELVEIWFDSGVLAPDDGGPDVAPLLARYQPHAMVLQSEAATIRHACGEDGMVDYPCWSTARRPQSMRQGHPDGKLWLPVECDVPIRNHEWFWRPDQDHKLFHVEELVEMYYNSVGRNGNLLINANPDRTGLIPDADFRRYVEFGKEIRWRFGTPLAQQNGGGQKTELRLNEPALIDHVVIEEDQSHGQCVRKYKVEGLVGADKWVKLCDGISIGHKRIQSFMPVMVAAVRLTCTEFVGQPRIRELAVYDVGL